MTERGRSIVIEGNDGTGKSTQVELLAKYLQDSYGIDSLTIHEPDGPLEICKQLRAKIKDATIPRTPEQNLEWFTESRHHSNRYGREHYIDKGGWVLRARNHRSTEAYQGNGEGIDANHIKQVTLESTDALYMNPDLEVILFVNDNVRKQRIASRGGIETPDTFESKGDEFQSRVNDAYISIAERDTVPLLDASQSIETVHREIVELIWLRGLLPPR